MTSDISKFRMFDFFLLNLNELCWVLPRLISCCLPVGKSPAIWLCINPVTAQAGKPASTSASLCIYSEDPYAFGHPCIFPGLMAL